MQAPEAERQDLSIKPTVVFMSCSGLVVSQVMADVEPGSKSLTLRLRWQGSRVLGVWSTGCFYYCRYTREGTHRYRMDTEESFSMPLSSKKAKFVFSVVCFVNIL